MNKQTILGAVMGTAMILTISSTIVSAATISKTTAKSTAQKYVPSTSKYVSTKYDDGNYDIKFFDETTNEKYEIEVSASKGTIISFDSELMSNPGSSTIKLSEKQAEQKVTNELSKVTILSTTLDNDDDGREYEVKFSSNQYSGTYKINPTTGDILDREIKIAPKTASKKSSKKTNTRTSTSTKISAESAKKTALNKVPNATIVKCQLDQDDGKWLYEIEMYKNGVEYSLDIDAYSGKILSYDVDDDNDYDYDDDYDDYDD